MRSSSSFFSRSFISWRILSASSLAFFSASSFSALALASSSLLFLSSSSRLSFSWMAWSNRSSSARRASSTSRSCSSSNLCCSSSSQCRRSLSNLCSSSNLSFSSSASLSACSRASRRRSASAALASSSVVIRIFAVIDAVISTSGPLCSECLAVSGFSWIFSWTTSRSNCRISFSFTSSWTCFSSTTGSDSTAIKQISSEDGLISTPVCSTLL